MAKMPQRARLTPSAGGKPDKLMRDALMIVGNEIEQKSGKRKFRVIADKLFKVAMDDTAGPQQIAAIKEITDRVDGKAHQSVAMTDSDGAALVVNVIARGVN